MTQDLELLRGKNILIVGDDRLVTDYTRRELEKCGAAVIGPVSSVNRALELVDERRPDAAILDINLDGEKVYPLVDILSERQIPFVFATGQETSSVPEKYRGFVLCEKPAELAVIAVALFSPERLTR